MTSTQHAAFGAEFRVASDGDGRTITGIAAPYGVVSNLVPNPGGEVFMRGAFKRSVANLIASGRLPKLFVGHKHDTAVGSVTGLEDTDDGLLFTARLAGTPAGEAALLEAREGTLDAISVGFLAVRERMAKGVREVIEARLLELSMTPMPSYERTALALRHAQMPVLPPMPKVDPALGLRIRTPNEF